LVYRAEALLNHPPEQDAEARGTSPRSRG
jgi:hypothetical protein